MKRKLLSKTYLKDIDKYIMNIYYDNNDYYIAVKNIIHVNKTFIALNGLRLIDDNYYIVEVLPKNENYAMRVFFNDKKERIEYYFDITLRNGIDEETKIPYYDDLYLDVIVDNENIEVVDEDELNNAYEMGEINEEEFNLANTTKDKLVESIKNKTNEYANLDLERYLK